MWKAGSGLPVMTGQLYDAWVRYDKTENCLMAAVYYWVVQTACRCFCSRASARAHLFSVAIPRARFAHPGLFSSAPAGAEHLRYGWPRRGAGEERGICATDGPGGAEDI